MNPPDSHQQEKSTLWEDFRANIKDTLNFYRIHVLVFTFTPLIAAGIFYASNGKFHIAFIDALFLCVSSMTVTGLATVDLSSLTAWQQTIMFALMCMGSPITVSWIIVYIRRNHLASTFEKHIMSHRSSAPSTPTGEEPPQHSGRPFFWMTMRQRFFGKRRDGRKVTWVDNRETKKGSKLRPDMIRRLERAPQPVDPSGWVSQGDLAEEDVEAIKRERGRYHGRLTPQNGTRIEEISSSAVEESDEEEPAEQTRGRQTGQRRQGQNFPRAHTIEFVNPNINQIREEDGNTNSNTNIRRVRSGVSRERSPSAGHRRMGSTRDLESGTIRRVPTYEPNFPRTTTIQSSRFPRTATMQSGRSRLSAYQRVRAKEREFGGFPYPHAIVTRLFLRFFPRLKRHLSRTLTVPQTMTIHSQHAGQASIAGARTVPYITFNAIVGRNSQFKGLTHEEMEELGGVEYRALNILLWLVAAYNITIPIIAYIIIAPYISIGRWRHVFEPPEQHKVVHPAWFSLFQVVSAYTNAGTSLVDQSMVPFQKAYPLIVILPLLILAGNTAFPIFLRFIIWVTSKVIDKKSRAYETLQFLLDHPRRCYIYLFPAHQTWFLLLVLLTLTFTDWFFFLVLDIGNPMIDSIPVHIRVGLGFLQATAVRAAGFSTVALSQLSAAVQVLYTAMMYISVYPIAMSVRSTNVYEERSLGIFTDPDNGRAGEEAPEEGHNLESRARIWGNYLAAHARKQLSFDMWWLATALFLLCIVERSSLENTENASWFNIFTIIFELTSAYGTVGLSLGLPNANYSFSGGLKPLSKLIVCAVMIRGRHRGLPVAIDRAVMFPPKFEKDEADTVTEEDDED